VKSILVYRAINAVSAELAEAGIPKTRTNSRDQYQYRSIDDVLNRLAPLLAKHHLCVLPKVLSKSVSERREQDGSSVAWVSACARRAAFPDTPAASRFLFAHAPPPHRSAAHTPLP
jgi:hypothetical protein